MCVLAEQLYKLGLGQAHELRLARGRLGLELACVLHREALRVIDLALRRQLVDGLACALGLALLLAFLCA